MASRIAETSHRGIGSLHETPVPATPLVTLSGEEELVFFNAPVHENETTDVSNVDVGQVGDIGNGNTRLVYGPVESVLIRGRGNNQQG